MLYAEYDDVTGGVVGIYDDTVHDEVPAMSVEITDAQRWQIVENPARYKIDVTTRTLIDVPVPPPTDIEVLARLESAVDGHIDATAQAKGYGRVGVSPSVACLGYASYPNPYQAEAVAFGEWMASLWPVCYQIQAAVLDGTRTAPTGAELIAELPAMVWP